MENSESSAIPPADSGTEQPGAPDSPAAETPPQPVKRGRGRPKKAPGAPKQTYVKGGASKRYRKRKERKAAAAPAGNEAADAVVGGAQARRARSTPAPKAPRQLPDWYRTLLGEGGQAEQRSVTQIRHMALGILESGAIPWAAALLADPDAKDSDKARAADFVAKLSAGYITPDMAGAEDVPELPAPIFTLTEGDLPGGAGVSDEALSGENPEEDTGGPQLAGAGGGGPSFTSSGAA